MINDYQIILNNNNLLGFVIIKTIYMEKNYNKEKQTFSKNLPRKV